MERNPYDHIDLDSYQVIMTTAKYGDDDTNSLDSFHANDLFFDSTESVIGFYKIGNLGSEKSESGEHFDNKGVLNHNVEGREGSKPEINRESYCTRMDVLAIIHREVYSPRVSLTFLSKNSYTS